ncbi:hypothetical protein C7E25_24535, partial [Stenotrophomonas maltophilia]
GDVGRAAPAQEARGRVSQDLPVLWSPAQQAWLQAMGYTVYHDGDVGRAAPAQEARGRVSQDLPVLWSPAQQAWL